LVYLWLVVEVGLVEEFFFRALLQSRLSVFLRSEVSGIVLGKVRTPKVLIFKKKKKKGMRRSNAHRQDLMRVRIQDISL